MSCRQCPPSSSTTHILPLFFPFFRFLALLLFAFFPFHSYYFPLTSVSFLRAEGWRTANVLSPDMTEFHGLSGRFSTKEGKFCEIVLARGTKEINSVARAGRRVWDDDAFKAQASGALCTQNALNTRSRRMSPFKYSI